MINPACYTGRVTATSIYIHIPFCNHRCGYCDFNTYAGLNALIPAYTRAIVDEINWLANSASEKLPVTTIYFGGGTPSLMPIVSLDQILSQIDHRFEVIQPAEISLEANPGTVSLEYLRQLIKLGVNRLSLGMQSSDLDELAMLERQHSFENVRSAVGWSRIAGFTNINLDLIYGLPYQGMKSWMNNIEAALSLEPQHLSLYALTLEEGTPMHRKVETGLLPKPDPDVAADMYDYASERLENDGYQQYEISNWASVSENGGVYACKHNMQYWRSLPYFGIGAGAHGFIDHQRTVNVATPGEYISRMTEDRTNNPSAEIFPGTPASMSISMIDQETEIGETMMMGLRLVNEGVSAITFQQRFGISLRARFERQINYLVGLGLLEWAGDDEDILRLTKMGRLLGNQVFKEFI